MFIIVRVSCMAGRKEVEIPFFNNFVSIYKWNSWSLRRSCFARVEGPTWSCGWHGAVGARTCMLEYFCCLLLVAWFTHCVYSVKQVFPCIRAECSAIPSECPCPHEEGLEVINEWLLSLASHILTSQDLEHGNGSTYSLRLYHTWF